MGMYWFNLHPTEEFSGTSEGWDKNVARAKSITHIVGSKKINKKLPLNTAKLLLSAALWGLRVSLLSPWRAACAAAREATPRWWPRTASWTTAPGPPAWTATRRPTWRPAAPGGSGPARLRPRTCSASGPWDPSAQVLQHQTQSLLHNQHNHSSSSNAPWSVQELWFHLSHSFAYKLLDFSSRLIPCFPSEKLKVVGRTVGFVLPGQDFPLAQIETLIMQYHSVPLGTTLELLPCCSPIKAISTNLLSCGSQVRLQCRIYRNLFSVLHFLPWS